MKRRKYYLLFAAVIFFAVSVPAYADLAPLNPEFTRWKTQRSEVQLSSGTLQNQATGYIPSHVNFSHLANNPPVIAAEDELPMSYDL